MPTVSENLPKASASSGEVDPILLEQSKILTPQIEALISEINKSTKLINLKTKDEDKYIAKEKDEEKELREQVQQTMERFGEEIKKEK